MRWPETTRSTVLLDPCAGEGEAIATLRDLWVADAEKAFEGREHSRWERHRPPSVVACELEEERARRLKDRLSGYGNQVFHGDAFRLLPGPDATGATVLYLNPPYAHDPEHGRLEQRFLARFTRHLHPGRGVLFFLVPGHALAASAELLAREYLELRAWRLPQPEYSAFGQVLVVGRRAGRPLFGAPMEPTIRRWAATPDRLPVLPEVCPEPLEVVLDEDTSFHLGYRLEPLDLTAALERFRPWEGEPVGVDYTARDLLGARFHTALPPKPAHIALALSSGMFNGHQLDPNDPRRDPPLLAKGTFERDYLAVGEKRDAEGDLVGVVEVEQPRLQLTILRLDSFTFHHLTAGTVPTGADDPADWNAADLIVRYDRSLAELLARQFPALHRPGRAEDRLALPPLARRPFRAQAEAIQAALKLLARGRNPFFVAEVGTGKSTMALYVAAALSPEHHAATTAGLRRLGHGGELPVVRRTLILCPPHLLASWKEQAAAVVPEARVQIVRGAADLAAEAEIYVLSRETAKLGHGYRGLEGRCPGCGEPIETSARSNAFRRRRCGAVVRRPLNAAAWLAEMLAALLGPVAGREALVGSLLRGRVVRRRRGRAVRRLRRAAAEGFLHTLVAEVERALGGLAGRGGRQAPSGLYQLLLALSKVARVLGPAAPCVAETRRRIDELLEHQQAAESPSSRSSDHWGPVAWLRMVSEDLAALVEPVGDEPAGDEPAGDQPAPPPPAPPEDLNATGIRALLAVLEDLQEAGRWEESPPCGEPLFQAVPPRRFPLARHILRRHRRRFDLVVLDEAHEFNHSASAQSRAAHRLTGLPGVPTLVLTGSLMGGYASSLFANFWALSPDFRAELGRDEVRRFVDRYGFRKTLRRVTERGEPERRGSHTDRRVGGRQVLAEAPGVMPTFILRHLLPTAVPVHKDDLDAELPPLAEEPVALTADPDDPLAAALLAEYERLQSELLARIRQDRFVPQRAGRLLGALVELPSYLDRAAEDLPAFELRYPEALGGERIATGDAFPAAWRSPKEAWLLAEVGRRRAAGEKVLVFLRHTGTPALPRRLLRLLEEITPRTAWLDAAKVPTARRQTWIDREVLAKEVDVLLVNPNAVRTGLNNLVRFSTGIWYQLDPSATTYRQANGRLHRIGQTRPVTILTPYYPGTAQETIFELVAKKVTASLQVDGLDLQAALEAAGASGDETGGLATAMSLGQAVYRRLVGGRG